MSGLRDPDPLVYLALLQRAVAAQESDVEFDVAAAARALDVEDHLVEVRLEELEADGLLLRGDREEPVPMVTGAGHQYLERSGEVPDEAVAFLPRAIDNLDTRAALLAGGIVLVDEFRAALVDGDGVDHACGLVPRAFREAVDERLAVDLFAAAVALMARLSAGEPAGCVAEEILAVALMGQAEVWLEIRQEEGEIDAPAAASATRELRALFELFQDDDVLDMFEMVDPGDAAVAGHDPINRQLGVADQRVEAWFEPFNWTAPTGYLHGRRSAD